MIKFLIKRQSFNFKGFNFFLQIFLYLLVLVSFSRYLLIFLNLKTSVLSITMTTEKSAQ